MSLESTIALMITFLLAGLGSAFTLVRYRRANQTAWLKGIMLLWYITASVLSIFTVCVAHFYPATGRYWTVSYNVAGQLISLTGIVDVSQFAYCRKNLLMLVDTNVLFVKIYLFASAVCVLVCVAIVIYDALEGINLTAYRSMTMLVIGTEIIMYAWAMTKLLVSKRAAVYYTLTFISRIGIFVSIISRIVGFLPSQTISIAHLVFVMVAVVPIGVFSMKPVKRRWKLSTFYGTSHASPAFLSRFDRMKKSKGGTDAGSKRVGDAGSKNIYAAGSSAPKSGVMLSTPKGSIALTRHNIGTRSDVLTIRIPTDFSSSVGRNHSSSREQMGSIRETAELGHSKSVPVMRNAAMDFVTPEPSEFYNDLNREWFFNETRVRKSGPSAMRREDMEHAADVQL